MKAWNHVSGYLISVITERQRQRVGASSIPNMLRKVREEDSGTFLKKFTFFLTKDKMMLCFLFYVSLSFATIHFWSHYTPMQIVDSIYIYMSVMQQLWLTAAFKTDGISHCSVVC